jgi:phenylalanyl-tRNA synthetase alpha chain
VKELYIDKDVSFADLKQTLLYLPRDVWKKIVYVLLFSIYGPSAEFDIYWGLKTETDYRITKGTGWLELVVVVWWTQMY